MEKDLVIQCLKDYFISNHSGILSAKEDLHNNYYFELKSIPQRFTTSKAIKVIWIDFNKMTMGVMVNLDEFEESHYKFIKLWARQNA